MRGCLPKLLSTTEYGFGNSEITGIRRMGISSLWRKNGMGSLPKAVLVHSITNFPYIGTNSQSSRCEAGLGKPASFAISVKTNIQIIPSEERVKAIYRSNGSRMKAMQFGIGMDDAGGKQWQISKMSLYRSITLGLKRFVFMFHMDAVWRTKRTWLMPPMQSCKRIRKLACGIRCP